VPVPRLHRSTGPPALEGRVIDVVPTPARAGDRPWWVRGAMVLAIAPGFLAALVLIFLRVIHWMVVATQKALFAKMTLGLLSGRSSGGGILGQLLSSIELKIKVDLNLNLGGGHDRVHTALRVRTSSGERICRVAFAPDLLAVVRGDEIVVWGREHSDGMLRAFELHDRTTGARHRPASLPPSVAVFAAISLVLCWMVLASLQGSGG
jgi:hypothetical protein